MQEEFVDQFISFEYHITGPFATAATAARGAWYGVSGVPAVRFDGKYAVDGAQSCDQVASAYRAKILQRLQETGQTSPVQIVASYIPLQTGIPISATFRLVDPATLSDLRATLILYEDNILYNGKHWNHVVREIIDEDVELNQIGDEATVSRTIPVDPAWNVAEIHAVAFLQQTSGDRPIVQGAAVPIGDFALTFARNVVSLPEGSGEALFEGQVTNVASRTDTLTIALESGFAGWPATFFLCGDPSPHVDPVDLILGPGEGCAVQVRVRTDWVREMRKGLLRATSHRSTRTSAEKAQVFNGSHSVLIADEDWDRSDEEPIAAALAADSLLYQIWDSYHAHGQDSPGFDDMSDFDYVIWQTGFYLGTYTLDRFDMDALMRYMDAGGALFLTSQQFLNSQAEPNQP